MSSSTTLPLSGISSYAVWLCRNSRTFLRVNSGSSDCRTHAVQCAHISVQAANHPTGPRRREDMLQCCGQNLNSLEVSVYGERR